MFCIFSCHLTLTTHLYPHTTTSNKVIRPFSGPKQDISVCRLGTRLIKMCCSKIAESMLGCFWETGGLTAKDWSVSEFQQHNADTRKQPKHENDSTFLIFPRGQRLPRPAQLDLLHSRGKQEVLALVWEGKFQDVILESHPLLSLTHTGFTARNPVLLCVVWSHARGCTVDVYLRRALSSSRFKSAHVGEMLN